MVSFDWTSDGANLDNEEAGALIALTAVGTTNDRGGALEPKDEEKSS
jgi:hypothetical protein